MEESTSISDNRALVADDVDGEVKGEVLKIVFKPTHDAKLRELLHKICSVEIRLCSDATKEFIKLLKGETGGELLHMYVQNSSKLTELLEAWKLRQGKLGMFYIFKLISAILSHPDGKCKQGDKEAIVISRAIDTFARLLVEEKLDDICKELTSKEGKRQNAALLLLTSIVRRGSGVASEVAKKFDFKIQGFSKLAEYKLRQVDKTRKCSTRKAFVGFAMSFFEVGKPGLLRWILQQREMYSGVLRGLGNDDEETLIYVLSTLKNRILVKESLIPPGLRSVLFGSVTLEQLVSVSSRENGGLAAKLAHNVLVMVCTDPCNGLMPDLKRHPNPLRGNPKRLLVLMKMLKATEVDHHRDLLMAIVMGRPSFAAAFLDEFPYNVEDYASPAWFSSVSLAANLVSSVGKSCSFDFLDSYSHETPSLGSSADAQNIIRCICPRPFNRSVINKGLLHSDFLVKHATLRLLLETLKLLDSFITALNHRVSSSSQMMQSWASLQQDVDCEVRNFLPDPQVLLTLLSSLRGYDKTQNPSLKRKAESENSLAPRTEGVKKSKKDVLNEDADIIVGWISSSPDISLPKEDEMVEDTGIAEGLDAEKEFLGVVSEIWASDLCSRPFNSLEGAEICFHTKVLDALRIYLRTMRDALEGSFEFFINLLSNPLMLPADLQCSLLSLLIEYVDWSPWSLANRIPMRTPPLMYKHLNRFISLLILSPLSDVKNLAYDLAQAAMFSTGAFDRNLHEIGAWFLFLPGYGRNKLSVEVQEAMESMSSVVISFLCDAISTIGNNLFKYWDIIRSYSSSLKDLKGLSPEFSPLIVCVLQKCLRLLNSESETYSLSEKSMISLYVSSTAKYLLQMQVDAGLLSNMIRSALSRLVDDSRDSFCEWRPLKTLLLFSETLLDKSPFWLLSGDKTALPTDNSFASTLNEVRKLVIIANKDEVAGILKAFSSALLCTTPELILKNFPTVMNVSEALEVPVSFLCSVVFLEETFLGSLSKIWPEKFFRGLEMAASMFPWKGAEDAAHYIPDRTLVADEITHSIDYDESESSVSAFCSFFKQAPFHVFFPAIMSVGISCFVEPSKIKHLLMAKISQSRSDCFISYLRQLLFWFHQIRSYYRVQPSLTLIQLSEICLILMKHLLSQILELRPDRGSSPSSLVLFPSERKQELALTIFCHPIVMAVLQHPLSCDVSESQNVEVCPETFLTLSRQRINNIDHHVLDLLATTCDYVLSDEQHFIPKIECGVNKPIVKAFNGLVERLLLELRKRFDLCVGTENSTSALQAFYSVHALIRFVSPIKLLELARWMFNTVEMNELIVRNSSKILSVGFGIAGGAFETLSFYLDQSDAKKQMYVSFWEIKENCFDCDLIEEIYAMVCKFATSFDLDLADVCLLKAINSVYRQKNALHRTVHPLTLVMARVIVRTPSEFISHCIYKTNKTRARLLFFLNELSPLHLSIFGHLFLGVLSEGTHAKSTAKEGISNSGLTDEQFILLLPAALSYLNFAFVKYGKKYLEHFIKITSFYSRILLNGFHQWQSFVLGYMVEERYDEFSATSAEEFLNLVDASVLGKAIHMLRYHFTLSGGSVEKTKFLKLFNSVFPCSAEPDELLDYDLKKVGFHSVDKLLKTVVSIVAKVSFFRMLLFSEESVGHSLTNKEDNNVKEMSLETESARGNSSKWLMSILVNTWSWIVKKLASVSNGSSEGESEQCLGLYKKLEDFILRSILEFTTNMRKDLIHLESIPFLERLMKSALLYRFGDATTLKRLREIFSLLSDGKFSRVLYLQLLLSHSQFAPTIGSLSKSSSSNTGELFRPMPSVLKSLILPCTDLKVAVRGDFKEPELSRQLELVKLLRVLLFNCGNETGINLRELHFLLLSSYGATLSGIDLEIYSLMQTIELINGPNSGTLVESDYLWGKAAAKLREEWDMGQDGSHVRSADSLEEQRRSQFRENLCVEPRLCASTVLWFPYQKASKLEPLSFKNIQPDEGGINEAHCHDLENIEQYDPSFILRFSIHCLTFGYIEPVEFACLGLLAVAFVSLSSADFGTRGLGYETLGKFMIALENCQKNKDITRLKLLMTYMQNGIEEQWQRIPSVTALFAAEASLILLDPSHEHYTSLSKLLMHSSRVKLEGVPLFHNFFWSSTVNFRTQRLWALRLVFAGLNSNDDAQVYIRNSIPQMLLSFYSSPVADNDSRELIFQIVRKSSKLHKMAKHLVEHCGLLPWLSSILSNITIMLHNGERSSSLRQLVVVAEVVNQVLSSRNIVDWLQKCALEQLMEISLHLCRLLVGRLILIKESCLLVDSILLIISSTLRISQKRKVYQPHFTLSLEGIVQIYEAVTLSGTSMSWSSAELGLKAMLMSTPPVDILYMDTEKLASFLLWGTSTALTADLKNASQANKSSQELKVVMEETEYEESLISKFLRWLIASVILGKLYSGVDDWNLKPPRRVNSETLKSLLENVEHRCQGISEKSASEQILATAIYYLQHLLGMNCRVLPSVVSALSLLLLHNASGFQGSRFTGDDQASIESLCSRILCPFEANPAWRWSYFQPWRDLSSEPTTDLQKIDELHACEGLLMIFSEMLGPNTSESQGSSLKALEIAFKWERTLVENM